MKKSLLVLLCVAACQWLAAYDVVYSYDAAGNRILREPKTVVLEKAMRSLPEGTDTESMLGEVAINYSPNPTKGILHVAINTDRQNVGAVQLYSLSGVLMQQFSGTNYVDFDLSGQQSGVYLLMVEVGSQCQAYKIVKE